MSFESLPKIPEQPVDAAYGISALYLFGTFQSRGQYGAVTGQQAPNWDPNRRPKSWRDDSKAELAQQDPEAICFYNGVKAIGGAPRIIMLAMPAWEAATVNIPSGEGGPPDARSRPSWEVPIRDLFPGEALDIAGAGPGGVIRVVNLAKQEAQDMVEGKFLPRDRAKLDAIAAKMGL